MKQFTKKLIGISLVVMMCLGACVSVSAASYRNTFTIGSTGISAGEVVFADNFDGTNDFGVNTKDTTSGYNTSGGGTWKGTTGELIHGNGEHAIKTKESDGNGVVQIKRRLLGHIVQTKAPKPYRVDMNFKVTSTMSYENLLVSGVTVKGNSKNSVRGVCVKIKDGKLAYMELNAAGDNNTTVDTGIAISADKWYNLSALIDITGAKWSLWLNGKKIVDDHSGLWDEIVANKDSSNIINWRVLRSRYNANPYNGNNPVLTIDDFNVYYEPVGYEKLLAEDFSGVKGETTSGDASAFYGTDSKASRWQNCHVDKDGVLVADGAAKTFAVFRLGSNRDDTAAKTGSVYTTMLDFKTTENVDNNGIVLQMRDGGSNEGYKVLLQNSELIANGKTLYKVVPGKWYRLAMFADITDLDYANKTGGKCVIYVGEVEENGSANLKCVENNLPFELAANATAPNKNILWRPLEITIVNAPVHFDNIVIYEDVRESILATTASSIGAETLGTGSNSIAIPTDSTSGYSLTWLKDGESISGSDSVTFEGSAAKTLTYTANASDAGASFTTTREFDIIVPPLYSFGISVSGGSATGNVTINANSTTNPDEGYNDGLAVLAIYSGTNLVSAKTVKVENGAATVNADAITKAGNYTARLFLWVDGTLKPLATDVSKGFTVQ